MEHLCVEVSFDDKTTKLTLLQALFEDVLLDRVDGDESVDVNSLRLPDPMRPILSLLIHRWVPIRVVKYHAVCPCQVDANTTAARRGNEAEDLRIQIEPVDHFLAGLDSHGAIQADVGVPVQVQESFQDVQHTGHLREYKHLRALHVQRLEQLCKAL